MEATLEQLFRKVTGFEPEFVSPLAVEDTSASARRYFRLKHDRTSLIGVHHSDAAENKAFVSFAKHFAAMGLPVPRVIAADLNAGIYLQDDLGDTTLFDLAKACGFELSAEVLSLYEQALAVLVRFQVETLTGFPFADCSPKADFDADSMRADVDYFKVNLAELLEIKVDAVSWQKDRDGLVALIAGGPSKFLMLRDFQARNLMVVGGKVFVVDFQGARRGPLQYDLVSLLHQPRVPFSAAQREKLLAGYLKTLKSKVPDLNLEEFRRAYPAVKLLRRLQALGAYGLRGLKEKKQHFRESIGPGLTDLREIINELEPVLKLPELSAMTNTLVGMRL